MKRVSVDDADAWAVLATCDRLVAEVEKRERVVEAARELSAALPTLLNGDATRAHHRLIAYLAALTKPR